MPLMKRLIRSPGYLVVVGTLLCAPAEAAEPRVSGSLPAVDGVNGKVAGFGGVADGRALYGGMGAVSVPLGHRYGLQIDGVVAGYDSRSQGDVTISGAAAHLFWRDPSQGLVGAYGHYVHADSFGGVDLFAVGVEGALYHGRFTLEGVAGVHGGKVDSSAADADVDTGFFDVLQLAYYPTENLKLSVGHGYMLDEHSALFEMEWGIDAGGPVMASLFVAGSISEHRDGAMLVGLRLHFGGAGKPLIRWHRENDPPMHFGGMNSGTGNVGLYNSGTGNAGLFNSGNSRSGRF